MSGATTWKPASASALIWWRQEYQLSGKPWHSKTKGPWPCSTIFRLMPLVLTIRSIGLLMVLIPPRPDRSSLLRDVHRRYTGETGNYRGRIADYVRQPVLATDASFRIRAFWSEACLGLDPGRLPVRVKRQNRGIE